jgi:hypothetical protein
MRGFPLNFRGFIAICLLAVYGLPAMVGPFWHHHGSCCATCGTYTHVTDKSSASEESSEDKASEAKSGDQKASDSPSKKAHRFGHCDGSCCSHRHAAQGQSESGSTDDSDSNKCPEDHRGSCAVCDFYAKAYYSALVFEIPEVSDWAPLAAESHVESPFDLTISLNARGPPASF